MRRFVFLFWYFAAWVPVAVIYGLLIYLQSDDRSAEGAFYGGIQSVLSAAVLGLLAWYYTRRLAERPRPALRLAAIHTLLALAYTTIWTLYVVGSIWLFAPSYVLPAFLQYALGWELLTGVLFYGLVAGIAHAVTVNARLRREREVTARAEALRTRAELNALRAQMNPHFLFNTLHSISALARTDPRAVEQSLERLASLLRRMLDASRLGVDQVTLADEWEIVRDQLELEKIRFGTRLTVTTDFDVDALECMVPIFTLQPLVENAIKHGVAARSEPSTVSIAARVRRDLLEIEVRDDGPGADARAVSQAQGLGLRSIRQRLMAQYGDRAGVSVETAPAKGFLVRVTLPASATPLPLPASLLTTAERAAAAPVTR